MNIKPKILSVFAVAVTFVPLLFPTIAKADTALQVSPAKTVVSAKPGERKQITIIVKNPGSSTSASVSFNNFAPSETGEPKIIQDDSYPQGIKGWLSGASSLSLATGGSASYVASITVPVAAKPGTYYGFVQFAPAVKDNLTLYSSVGSLILVNVGAVTQQAVLEDFDVTGIEPNPNLVNAVSGTFAVRIKNTGTGYFVPQIKIDVLDSQNAVIDTLDANKALGGVLPGSIRKYTLEYSKNLDLSKPYHARVTATVGTSKPMTLEKQLTTTMVYSVPPPPPPTQVHPATPTPVTQVLPAHRNNLIPVIIGVIAVLGCGALAFVLMKSRRNSTTVPTPPMQPPVAPPIAQAPDHSDDNQDSNVTPV